MQNPFGNNNNNDQNPFDLNNLPLPPNYAKIVNDQGQNSGLVPYRHYSGATTITLS